MGFKTTFPEWEINVQNIIGIDIHFLKKKKNPWNLSVPLTYHLTDVCGHHFFHGVESNDASFDTMKQKPLPIDAARCWWVCSEQRRVLLLFQKQVIYYINLEETDQEHSILYLSESGLYRSVVVNASAEKGNDF